MLQSHLFTKTRKEAPKDEVAKNAQLLIRAGFIHKQMAGVYALLPLGVKVMNNIANVVREEMNAIGGVEVSLTALQDKTLWEKTGRWDDKVVDNWFKTKLKNDTEVGLGFTHEEPLTNIMKEYVRSYKDLPVYAYQIQTKFRNEARAKSGIIRGREFLMKDLYSFSKDEAEHQAFYTKTQAAYKNVFDRIGIGERTYMTFASGGSFSKYSHEFQTVTDAGEDTIFVDEKKKLAVNKEVLNDEVLAELGIKRADLIEKKAVEVGNIFSLGTRFSEPLELNYSDAGNASQKVVMGSYGIGIGRLMGTVAEVLSDENGLVWPASIAPFKVHLIALFDKEGKVKEAMQVLYKKLGAKWCSENMLYDDRDLRPGDKFADSDLIGISTRIMVSEKTLAESADLGGMAEVKDRATGKITKVALSELDSFIKSL